MPTASSLAWKTSLRKVRTLWHCSRLRSVALYPWLIVADIRQAIDRCSNIWASIAGRWLWSVRAQGWQPDCKIQRSGRETVREIDVWAESPRLFRALVICIIVCSPCNSTVNDNAITYKAQRQKCQRTEAGERGNYWHADASAWCCCARCKIRRS